MLRNVADTLRYQRGWRPEPDPWSRARERSPGLLRQHRREPRRGDDLGRVREGDNLHVDVDGSYWEHPRRAGQQEKQRLVEITREEAEAKYGRLD